MGFRSVPELHSNVDLATKTNGPPGHSPEWLPAEFHVYHSTQPILRRNRSYVTVRHPNKVPVDERIPLTRSIEPWSFGGLILYLATERNRLNDLYLVTKTMSIDNSLILATLGAVDTSLHAPQAIILAKTNKRVVDLHSLLKKTLSDVLIGECTRQTKECNFSNCQVVLGTARSVAEAIISEKLNTQSVKVFTCEDTTDENAASDSILKLFVSKLLPTNTQVICHAMKADGKLEESHWLSELRPHVTSCYAT